MGGRIRQSGEIERRGYTLVEIIVVVGILIVLAAIGLPLFSVMMQSSRLDAATRQIAGDLREARSRATQTGWDYKIVGFNVGGGSAYKNQYRLLGRQTGVAWPADTGPDFNFPSPPSGATQMAGPWTDFNQLYQGVSLNPSVSTQSFYVSFNSRGAVFESMSFPLTITLQSGGSRQITVTSIGGVRTQ
jgi:prepilin-type N-terminal cleavage/methylation domain-containing protein